ncbi:MAG: MFS transporter [Streptosporangiales bacterium]|nr:MFS transporter [Streptosporangiales bacterium]
MSATGTPAAAPVADPQVRRREQRGWYFYDWANSAFVTTVISVFLGPYLTSVTQAAAAPGEFVHPLGIPVRAESFFPFVVSVSVIVQVLLLPVVGAFADRSGRKKALLALCAYAGAAATMGLYFLQGENYLLGGGLFIVANAAYGSALVVYYSLLPEIAEPNERDRVSSVGWALGFLGGGLLLLANLAVYQRHEALGLTADEAVRICLLSAGVWWAVFTVIPLRRLRSRTRTPTYPAEPPAGAIAATMRQLGHTLREARSFPQTLLFLAAFLLYNDGIQTVATLAPTFGVHELELDQEIIIVTVLMVQFVAFLGALLLGALARVFGARRVVLASLVCWIGVASVSYFLEVGAVGQFFALGFVIGLVLGGSQALSRSLFSHLVPPRREAEYFSLYQITERGTTWLGTFLAGIALQWTGSYRAAILSLLVFFVAGLVLLALVNMRRGIEAVGNEQPNKV